MGENDYQIDLRFYVLTQKNYSGPINFGVWSHHKPSLVINPGILTVLGFSPDTKLDGKLHLYHVGKRRFLYDNDTYKEQEVGPFDIVVLTDQTDTDMIETVMSCLIKAKESESSKSVKLKDPKQFEKILEDF